jgi:hypothetical protein
MPQNITFDTASGIDLTGWWCNPHTGESYRVVDQFFQDNVLYVKTDKGQMLNYAVIQNLVKSDGPLKVPVTPQKPQPVQTSNDILLDGLVEEDIEILTQPVHRNVQEKHNEKPKPESVNKMIIEKAFSKADSAPEISLGIDWNWSGLSQTLVMLKETMDIPTSEIVDYLYDKYSDQMVGNIKTILGEYVDRGGGLVGR